MNRVLRFSGYSGSLVSYSLDFNYFFDSASGKRTYLLKCWCLLNTNAGLYSGLGSLTLGRISGVGARFGVYEILTAFYKGIIQIPCQVCCVYFR